MMNGELINGNAAELLNGGVINGELINGDAAELLNGGMINGELINDRKLRCGT